MENGEWGMENGELGNWAMGGESGSVGLVDYEVISQVSR